MKIRLVRPTEQLKEQAINFRQEFFDNHEMVINGSELLDKTDQYEDWLKAVAANTSIETVSVNWVVTDTFFAVDEKDQIIGIIDLRHTLNDFLKSYICLLNGTMKPLLKPSCEMAENTNGALSLRVNKRIYTRSVYKHRFNKRHLKRVTI